MIVTGGGRKNKVFIKSLQKKCAIEVMLAEDIGINGDILEAEAFGYLAVRSKLGKPYTFENTTGVNKTATGGILFNYNN